MNETSEYVSKRIVAGVCGILVGGFGIHKFILGYQKEALIMLGLSLTCCAFPIMQIIGFIEGIIYLAKPDAEFIETYVYNKKGWF